MSGPIFKWCVKHGDVLLSNDGSHSYYTGYTMPCGCCGDLAYDCFGPYAECAPPELEEDWQDLLIEPAKIELAWMDLSAESLLLEQ